LARARGESALLDNRASHHSAAIGRSGISNGHRIRGDAPVCERECRLRSRTRLACCHPDRSEGSAGDQLQISRLPAHLGTISSPERTLACLVRNDHVCGSERSPRLTGKSSQRTSKSRRIRSKSVVRAAKSSRQGATSAGHRDRCPRVRERWPVRPPPWNRRGSAPVSR
jgi:hypothetical protein